MPGLHVHLPQPSQSPWEVTVPISQIRKLSHQAGKSLIHSHAPSNGRSGVQGDPVTVPIFLQTSLLILPLSPLLPPTPPSHPSLPPTSLLHWNPDSLLLSTVLFTLSTEHPRENILPKKTNAEEPAVGAGGTSESSRKNSAPNGGNDLRDPGQMRPGSVSSSY